MPVKIESKVTNPQIKTYDTDSTAIQDLALGDGRRLDAVVSRSRRSGCDRGRLADQDRPSGSLLRACGRDRQELATRSTSLVERISEIIEEMHEDGTMVELSEKWYRTDLTVAPRKVTG